MSTPSDEPAKDAAQAAAAAEGLFPLSQPEGGVQSGASPGGDEARPGVRKLAIQNAIWLGLGIAASTALKIIQSSILSRLLATTVYGLMGIADVFLQGLHMFSDVGIGQAIVQSKRGEDRIFLNTAWTMHVVRGFILWLATFVIAWPVAAFYGEPTLLILIPAMGFIAALGGFKSTALFTLDRRLLQGRATLLDLTVTVVGVVVTLVWARWVAPDVWAFFAGSLTQTLLLVALSHIVLPGSRNGFSWDKTAARELFQFGKWIFISTAITFLAFQADRLLIPKLEGVGESGIYGRAGALAGMATGLMSTFVGKLIFPVYSRMHQEGRDIRTEFGRVHSTAAAFAALLVIGMLSAGPALCWTLYGSAYHDAGWMLPIVAVGAWFQMIEGTTGASLLALGKPVSVTAGNFSRLIGVLIFVPLGYWAGGLNYWGLEGSEPHPQGSFIGILVGFIAADIIRYLVAVYLARINGMSGLHYDVAFSLLILVVSPVAHFAGTALAHQFVGPDARAKIQNLVEFFCQGILAVVLWGTVFLAWWAARKRINKQRRMNNEE